MFGFPMMSTSSGVLGLAPESFNGYTKEKTLGNGSFGVVYQVSKNNRKFALKVVVPNDKEANNEVRILNNVRHRNIISYYESFMLSDKLCIVMELAAGTFTEFVEINAKRADWNSYGGAEQNVCLFLGQMVDALSYLHNFESGKILHRDLKSDNILGVVVNGCWTWKLADFGVSKVLDQSKLYSNTAAGTKIYTAPEVLKYERYNDTADVWSLGAVMSFYCNKGTHLFSSPKEVLDWPGGRSTLPSHYDINLRNLVASMLNPDRHSRPNAKKILQEMQSRALGISTSSSTPSPEPRSPLVRSMPRSPTPTPIPVVVVGFAVLALALVLAFVLKR